MMPWNGSTHGAKKPVWPNEDPIMNAFETSISLGVQSSQAAREAFYARIDPQNMAPLWTRLKSLVPAAPTPIGVPHQWRYADVRPFVLESATHISAEEIGRASCRERV